MSTGDSAVGKSTFLRCLIDGGIRPVQQTVSVSLVGVVDIQVKGRTVPTKLWDTAGHPKHREMVHRFFRKPDTFLVLYDIGNRKSFDSVSGWVAFIRERGRGSPVMIIAWNKRAIPAVRGC
jgi:small GTP-binding protein